MSCDVCIEYKNDVIMIDEWRELEDLHDDCICPRIDRTVGMADFLTRKDATQSVVPLTRLPHSHRQSNPSVHVKSAAIDGNKAK